MSTGTKTARRAVLRWLVMPAVLISLAAGLGSLVPVPQAAADAAWMTGSPDSPTVPAASATTNTATISVGTNPIGVGVDPSTDTVYVANTISNTVSVINEATNTVTATIGVGNYPNGVGADPATHTVYVTNTGSNTVSVITPATVTGAPAFTSGSAATARFGVAFTFTVTATGDPAPTIIKTGALPSGVKFTDDGDGTATISGTPRKAAAGVYPLTLTARNKNGTATQAFTLTVTRAPAIRRVSTVRTRVGAALRLTIRTTGYPAPALAESGPLPGGLSFTDNGNGTAVIRGTPAPDSDGRYPITITATNTSGTATQHFTITITQCRRR